MPQYMPNDTVKNGLENLLNDFLPKDIKNKKQKNIKIDGEKYDRLLKLGRLKDKGYLTDEEFQNEKQKILNDE